MEQEYPKDEHFTNQNTEIESISSGAYYEEASNQDSIMKEENASRINNTLNDNKGERKDNRPKEPEGKPDIKKSPVIDNYPREGSSMNFHFFSPNQMRGGGKLEEKEGRPINIKGTYPELLTRSEKESEFSVHFYIENISSSYPHDETYKKLYDILILSGEVKELSYQKINNDTYRIFIGMKYDDDAKHIIEKDKLKVFISTIEKSDIKPHIETGVAFSSYLKFLKEGGSTERKGAKPGEKGIDKEKNREKESANKERAQDQRSAHRSTNTYYDANGKLTSKKDHSPEKRLGSHYQKGSERESRSRSRSKSPPGLSRFTNRPAAYDPNKVYQVKDILNERRAEVASKSSVMEQEKAGPQPPGPVGHTLPTGGHYQVAGVLNQPPAPGEKPEKLPNIPKVPTQPQGVLPPPGKEGPNKVSSTLVSFNIQVKDQENRQSNVLSTLKEVSKQALDKTPVELPNPKTMNEFAVRNIPLENCCIFLGIPLELTEAQVRESLEAQGFPPPVYCEWGEEGVMQFLKLGFKSDKTVKDLILRDINLGPTDDNLIYPPMVLPCILDMKINELLIYHQVLVDSSIPVDSLFLHLFYCPYGPIIDIIDMKPTHHAIIFAKQPHAQYVLGIPQISLQKENIEIVMNHAVVESCYPLVRKRLQSHMKTVLQQYMKSISAEDNQPVDLDITSDQHMLEYQENQHTKQLQQQHEIEQKNQPEFEQQHQQYLQNSYIESQNVIRDDYTSGAKPERKGPGGRYYETSPTTKPYNPNSRFIDEGPYLDRERSGRGQFSNQNYRGDKYYPPAERTPERTDFYEGNKRRDFRGDRNQNYNQRYNQGYGGGGQGGNRPYNYQQNRNPEMRQGSYYQNMNQEPRDVRSQYQQGRNPENRPQERNQEYRMQPSPGFEQRQQQPPYNK